MPRSRALGCQLESSDYEEKIDLPDALASAYSRVDEPADESPKTSDVPSAFSTSP